MSIRHLPYFLVVAEEANLRRAAERLGLTTSALSRRMQDLEQELGGIELFRRTRSGIVLTRAGEAYRVDVERALHQLDQAGMRAGSIDRGEVGTLRLGFNAIAFRQRFLGAALQRYTSDAPGVHLELQPAISHRQLEMLHAGTLDVGLLSERSEDDGFESLHLQEFPMLLTLADTHRLAGRSDLRLADLAGEKLIWITRASSPAIYDQMIGEFRAAGVTPRITYETYSAATMSDLIGIGAGIGFMSRSFERGLPAGLRQQAVPDFRVRLPLYMTWRRNRQDALLRRFIDTVQAVRADTGPTPQSSSTIPS